MLQPLSQIVFLLRFFCFIAVVYLALHGIVARCSRKPDSKLLWFFGIVTAPLIRPVKRWLAPQAVDDRLRSTALLFYLCLWLLIVVIDRFLTAKPA